MHFNRTAKIS